MNQITTQEAIQNLDNLIKSALRGGLFSEPEAVFAMKLSLDHLAQIAQMVTQQKNGKKEEVPQDEGVS